MKKDFIFTSESVTEGHPDKLCDQVADAIVDRFLQVDPRSNIVAEAAVAAGVVFIATRFAANTEIDIAQVARQVIRQVDYAQDDFNAENCSIMTSLSRMPVDTGGVDESRLSDSEIEAIPARNQVTVFGYACTQTPALMPLPIWLAHKLARGLTTARLSGDLRYLAPDGSSQVAVEYRDRRPARIHSITLVAAQTAANGAGPLPQQLHDDLVRYVIEPAFAGEAVGLDPETRIFVNPDGRFIGGGPAVHSGLTGRKNAIDTYGEFSRHSGSALSGKGPARIDRTGAYAARHAAKHVVAAGLAEECEVHLSYAIGQSHPVSIQVDTFGAGQVDDDKLAAVLEQEFDFRPAGIARRFELRRLPSQNPDGFFRKLAAYGQVGRMDLDLPWEALDQVATLRKRAAACS